MLTDTHCHLYFDAFDPDREAVLDRARRAGVERILCPGIDLPTSRAAVALAQAVPEVYAAVGVHPNDSAGWQPNLLDELRELARHPKVVAIGEIGLDYYWEKVSHDLQQQALRSQLGLAGELGLPVVVHTRSASPQDTRCMADALDILAQWQAELAASGSPLAGRPGVLHSFSGEAASANRAIQSNFQIGITGPVTFKNAPGLQMVAAALPLNSLLVETDS
ncbi:MAG TPA: TatD family hydrolase, partial [Anaerolineales bacterium]